MWFIIIFLVIIFTVKILLSWRRPSTFPPGPRGLPIVGNILDIKRLVDETKFYSHAWCRLADIYGPIVGLKLGLAEPLIIVSGKDAVIEMMSQSQFDGRPNGFIHKLRTGGKRKGVMFTDGEIWRDQRRFVLRTLKEFGLGNVTMEDLILNDAVSLTTMIDSLAKLGPINNLYNITSIAVLNSLWTLVAGARFDLDNPKLTEILTVVNEIIRNTNATGGILTHLPFLRYIIPGLSGFTALNQRYTQMLQFIGTEIARHKQTRTDGEFRDFIDVYLAEMDTKQSTVSSFDEEQLISVVKDLFTAGVETTNNTIGFIITYLVVCQDVQKKVHEEIDRVLGKEILPRIVYKNRYTPTQKYCLAYTINIFLLFANYSTDIRSKIFRLPYLNATIAEVMRLANIGPTSIPHRALTDSVLLGYKIKKNYTLLANLRSVHMDEQHWGDPKIFRPERFINEKGDYVEDSWLIPFGLGHRKCLGETLARNSVFLFTACLLQKFQFVLPPDHPDPILDGIDGFTIAPPRLSVIVKKRK
ncbi:methyl farnesoate epoxidase isoform X2 [Monomorium pharaonis]|uniref:methyl farnesoate epoxidase isoform X2 n=1 Tax=Monomorium pharaonis TaxID=307658 RepID=UPI0017467CDD|nr:methyl farnesoate epoxidase isoform X2 [Monomorium pharaonis]